MWRAVVVGARKETAAETLIGLATRAPGWLQELFGVECVAAPRADRRQLRKPGDLDAPAFVVREVHVKGVELVAREQVDRAQHRRLGLEVARHVEHESAVAKPRRVHHLNRRKRDPSASDWCGKQRAQRLEAIEDAGGRNSDDSDSRRGIDGEAVRFGRRLALHRPDLEAKRLAPPPRSSARAHIGPQVFGRERRLVRELRRRVDLRHSVEPQLSRSFGDLERRREDR